MPAESEIIEIIPGIAIPDFMVSEIQSKLAYADERIASVYVRSEQISIHLFAGKSATKEQRIEIEEKVQRVVSSLAKGAIQPKYQILEDHLDRRIPYHDDPHPALFSSGQIYQEAPGIFTLGPLVTLLITFFEDQFIELANSFGAKPYRFPTLIPAKFLERVNYFRAFPHSLTFVTHLREDLDVIDEFSQHAACSQEGLNTPSQSFSRIQTLLSPAVCYHLYYSLADKSIPDGQVTATAVGNCFRFESINLVSLERMWNFTMREIIFVGSKDFVLENRELARQRVAERLAQIGFAYKVESANDPFFIGEFRKQAAFQSAFQLKFEIHASLPYKDSTLAVGSYNYHQDFFGRNLNISLLDGKSAHTGCVAFGLERMALAFLAQFGPNPSDWPAEVSSKLKT